MAEPLIKGHTSIVPTHLTDFYLAIAHNIEASLIEAGATPGKDYKLLDLYQLAQPIVAEQFKSQNLEFSVSWR